MPANFHDTRIDKPHIDKTRARAGITPGVVRYVLGIGLGLAIIALSAIWMSGAIGAADDGPRPVEASRQQNP